MKSSNESVRGEVMQKIMLLASAWLVLGIGSLNAKQMYREKTYVAPVSSEHTRALLWTNLMQQVDMVSCRRKGGRLQVTTSASMTTSDRDFAHYFGMYNPMRNTVESFIGVDQNDPNELLSSMSFIHDYARASNTYAGYGIKERLDLRPEKQTLACVFDYVHGFDVVCEGMSFRVSIPFVSVKTSMNPRSIILDAHGMNLPDVGTHVTLADYLAGIVENTSQANLQAPLKKLKITRGSHTVKGLSDVEMAFRARLWKQGSSHLDVGLKGVFPVSSDATGEFLFEPQRGNGGHRGVGGEVLLDFLAVESDSLAVEVVLNVDYTYLFASNEIRVPHFRDAQGNIPPFAAYQLGGRIGTAGMFPLANVLAREFKVTPGHRLEAVLSGIVSNQGLSLEVGGAIKARSQEKVEALEWDDDVVGLVAWDYNATSNVTRNNLFSTASIGQDGVAVNAPSNLRTINRASLALESITTPSLLTGYVYGFAGYSYADWPYPLSFGLGLLYELPVSSNATAPVWNMMFKFGVNF